MVWPVLKLEMPPKKSIETTPLVLNLPTLGPSTEAPILVCRIEELKEPPLDDAVCLSDGKVRLLLLRTNDNSYISMRQGLDHIGFQVESLSRTKQDLEELTASAPASAPKDIGAEIFGHYTRRDMDACRIGTFAVADPDGVLLDFSED